MSRIGATLEAGDEVIGRRQDVHYLSLTFVAPLQAEQDIYLFHHVVCIYSC